MQLSAIEFTSAPLRSRNEGEVQSRVLGVNQSIDPIRETRPLDIVSGRWSMQDLVLKGEAPHRYLLDTLVEPNGSYRLELKFKRVGGLDGLSLALPVGDRPCILTLGGWPKDGRARAHCIHRCKSGWNNETTSLDFQWEEGKEHLLTVHVSLDDAKHRARVVAQVDDRRPLIDWRGHPSQLSLGNRRTFAAPRRIGIGGFNSILEFRQCKFTALSGGASIWEFASSQIAKTKNKPATEKLRIRALLKHQKRRPTQNWFSVRPI